MILAPGVYATTFRGEDGRRVVGVKIGAQLPRRRMVREVDAMIERAIIHAQHFAYLVLAAVRVCFTFDRRRYQDDCTLAAWRASMLLELVDLQEAEGRTRRRRQRRY